jgi:hypothetical protein
MSDEVFTRRLIKVCAWTGVAFCVLFLIGAVPLARVFAPPYSAMHTAVQVQAFYVRHLTGIRLGCFVMMVASALFLPFGLSITAVVHRSDAAGRLLTWIQIASVAVATVVIFLIPVFWGVASYRAGHTSAQVTQSWNDAGWFGVLFAVPPFSVWCIAIAVAIFRDGVRVPRWVAYLNIWAALLFVPAMLMIFFHHGAFSQNGLITFWEPVAIFFAWIVTMTVVVTRAADRPGSADAGGAGLAGGGVADARGGAEGAAAVAASPRPTVAAGT